MGKVNLTIEAKGDGIPDQKQEFNLELPEGANHGYAAKWLMYWLSTEFKVEDTWLNYLNKLPDPKLVEVSEINVRTNLSSGPSAYYDSMNTGKAWLEAYNQLLSARTHLARARAYKAVEAEYSKNEMHVLHERKMAEFHHAVRNIKKIEDMMLRLIFEALGTSLKDVDRETGQPFEIVDTTKDEWERKLTLDKVRPALKQRDINGRLKSMDDAEYNELRNIVGALNHRANQKLWDFWQYRHKLEHRMPQSVDYAYLYPSFEGRPEPLIEDGKQVGMISYMGSLPTKAEWSFEDLYDTTVSVYKHYLSLLSRLDKLPTFARPNRRVGRG